MYKISKLISLFELYVCTNLCYDADSDELALIFSRAYLGSFGRSQRSGTVKNRLNMKKTSASR